MSNCKYLKSLNISKIGATEIQETTKALSEISSLEELYMRQTRVQISLLDQLLTRLPKLRIVDFEFSSTIARDFDLKTDTHISTETKPKGQNLESLVLPYARQEDAFFAETIFNCEFPKLTRVYTTSPMSLTFPRIVKCCPNLSEVSVTLAGDNIVEQLESMPNLTAVRLQACGFSRVNKAAFLKVASNPKISNLEFYERGSMSILQFIKLFKVPHDWVTLKCGFREFDQHSYYKVDEVDWEKVQLLPQPNLKKLLLSKMNAMDVPMAFRLFSFSMFPNLEQLEVSGIPVCLSNVVLERILYELPNLKKLTLGEIRSGQAAYDIKSVLQHGNQLEVLRIGFCRHKSSEFWKWIFQSFPSINKIRLFSTGSSMNPLSPDFWGQLKQFGRSITKATFVQLAQVATCSEFKQFAESTKRVHLIKIVGSPTPSTFKLNESARCQVVIYGSYSSWGWL